MGELINHSAWQVILAFMIGTLFRVTLVYLDLLLDFSRRALDTPFEPSGLSEILVDSQPSKTTSWYLKEDDHPGPLNGPTQNVPPSRSDHNSEGNTSQPHEPVVNAPHIESITPGVNALGLQGMSGTCLSVSPDVDDDHDGHPNTPQSATTAALSNQSDNLSDTPVNARSPSFSDEDLTSDVGSSPDIAASQASVHLAVSPSDHDCHRGCIGIYSPGTSLAPPPPNFHPDEVIQSGFELITGVTVKEAAPNNLDIVIQRQAPLSEAEWSELPMLIWKRLLDRSANLEHPVYLSVELLKGGDLMAGQRVIDIILGRAVKITDTLSVQVPNTMPSTSSHPSVLSQAPTDLVKLTSFTFRGNVKHNLPGPWYSLSRLPFKQLTTLRLYGDLSVDDCIEILYQCELLVTFTAKSIGRQDALDLHTFKQLDSVSSSNPKNLPNLLSLDIRSAANVQSLAECFAFPAISNVALELHHTESMISFTRRIEWCNVKRVTLAGPLELISSMQMVISKRILEPEIVELIPCTGPNTDVWE
ncbi:hypothetical protein Hypma_008616 [Hypsizygus marmoreus]|uniref:Uncharacterized protein n=1 Tax=Hypsizygus marmoreus TaxID=39966 RepID=A0A369JQQ9_HYPMA|nr:hypothetical protein Hypma_008616 [Hypsizygus marmoreus]